MNKILSRVGPGLMLAAVGVGVSHLVYSTQVLDYIFPKERRIRAIIGGLETSLGTKLWEQLAKLLASENGFEVLDEK